MTRRSGGGFKSPNLTTFMCHQQHEAVCRGWLTVHSESVAVRLAQMTGRLATEAVYAPVTAALYKTGREARDAGMKGVRRPGRAARAMIAKLVRKVGR